MSEQIGGEVEYAAVVWAAFPFTDLTAPRLMVTMPGVYPVTRICPGEVYPAPSLGKGGPWHSRFLDRDVWVVPLSWIRFVEGARHV